MIFKGHNCSRETVFNIISDAFMQLLQIKYWLMTTEKIVAIVLKRPKDQIQDVTNLLFITRV